MSTIDNDNQDDKIQSSGKNLQVLQLTRRASSTTGSLELNLLQDDEDELEFSHNTTSNYDNNVTNDDTTIRHHPNQDHNSTLPQQHQQQHQRRDHVYYLSVLFAGAGSGALSSFICAPLDLIRTRMQVWGEIQQEPKQKSSNSNSTGTGTSSTTNNSNNNKSKLNNIMNNNKKITPAEAFRAIIKKEGLMGIFRGLGATLLTVPLFWGVYFPLYDETKHYLQTSDRTKDFVSNYHPGLVHCISAISTGAVADLICNPLFVVRTRLQTQALHELTSGSTTINNRTRPTSMIQMANQLHTKHGITVFWRGMTANIMGLSHCAVQFPAYEFLKRYFREKRRNDNNNNSSSIISDNDTTDNTVGELLISSGMAKMTASLLTYPHEVLRSRMMDDRSSKAPTLRGTATHIYRREGFKGYYNGLTVTLLRVVPNCCVTFLSYELILKYSKEHFQNNRNRY